jgi:hypothetical protein
MSTQRWTTSTDPWQYWAEELSEACDFASGTGGVERSSTCSLRCGVIGGAATTMSQWRATIVFTRDMARLYLRRDVFLLVFLL